MLSKHENRVIYVLNRAGGQARKSVISMAMARARAVERAQALSSLEALGLISSAKTPPAKAFTGRPGRGAGATVYWLTADGKAHVKWAIDRGDLDKPRPALVRASRGPSVRR